MKGRARRKEGGEREESREEEEEVAACDHNHQGAGGCVFRGQPAAGRCLKPRAGKVCRESAEVQCGEKPIV